MPIYEYECQTCRHRFELQQKFTDPPIDTCPQCGAAVRKLISAPGLMFKGTGWYITDYSDKLKDPAAQSGKGDSKGEAKGDAGKGDSAKGDSAKSESGGGANPPSSSSSSSSTPAPAGSTSPTPSSTKPPPRNPAGS